MEYLLAQALQLKPLRIEQPLNWVGRIPFACPHSFFDHPYDLGMLFVVTQQPVSVKAILEKWLSAPAVGKS